MTGRFLVADIGATNARFALLEDLSVSALGATATLSTGDYPSSAEMLQAVRHELPIAELAAACFAVAGPVRGGKGRLTNRDLVVDSQALQRELGCPVTVVNDMVALAQGVPRLGEFFQIGGDALAQGVTAVVAPGSGFGVSVLVPGSPRPQVLASEGGHSDLAPGSPLEQEILQLLSQQLGRQFAGVSWETVLSGPGLVNLYRAMATLWGAPPKAATAEWVCEQGRLAGDPICHQTLDTFFGFLGAAAGNLALTFAASGGVNIGGGIVPRITEFALASPLRRRFEERAGLADYVADLPIRIIMDAHPGLVGACECLRVRGY